MPPLWFYRDGSGHDCTSLQKSPTRNGAPMMFLNLFHIMALTQNASHVWHAEATSHHRQPRPALPGVRRAEGKMCQMYHNSFFSTSFGSYAEAELGNFKIHDHLSEANKPAVSTSPNSGVRSVSVIVSSPSLSTLGLCTVSHDFKKVASAVIPSHFGLGLDVTLGPYPAFKVLLGSLA